MSDKQTTAVVLLVILSLVFYLYNQGRLGTVIQTITGNKGAVSQFTITNTAANAASNAELTASNVQYDSQGLDTGYFLNSLYGFGKNGEVQYSQQGGSGSNSSLISDLSTVATLATLFG